MIIEFEDFGQDFLEWELDQDGKVVESIPFQTSTWGGIEVLNFKRLKPGDKASFYDKHDGELRTIQYPIKSIK